LSACRKSWFVIASRFGRDRGRCVSVWMALARVRSTAAIMVSMLACWC
jgi:hypothetical protein